MPTPELNLAVRDLTARAEPFALGPVSLDVPAGRVLVILGPSGSGKATLLTVLAGLRASLCSRVRLAGDDITTWPPESRRIGMVFQDGARSPTSPSATTSGSDPAPCVCPTSPARTTCSTSLASPNSPTARLGPSAEANASGSPSPELSRSSPRLLLLDEPLSALHQPTREEMRGQLRQLLTQQSIPAIHVTHDRDEAFTLADDLAIITDGTIRQAGSARDVAAHPRRTLRSKTAGLD